MTWRYLTLSGAVGVAALLCDASPALAQAFLGGNLRPFAVLAGSTVTCTGASIITGDIGVSPGAAIVGFPAPCTNIGTLHPADVQAAAAQADLVTAYNTLASLPCSSTIGPDLAGLTLVPGIYCVPAAASNLTGTVTLDGQGNGNASWVFRMSSTLITSPGSIVNHDQWRQSVRGGVASQQLRDHRYQHPVPGQHPRAHGHHDEHGREPDRQGPGA